MHKSVWSVFAASVLAACGGSGSTDDASTFQVGALTSEGFQRGVIATSATNLGEGDSAVIVAYIFDAKGERPAEIRTGSARDGQQEGDDSDGNAGTGDGGTPDSEGTGRDVFPENSPARRDPDALQLFTDDLVFLVQSPCIAQGFASAEESDFDVGRARIELSYTVNGCAELTPTDRIQLTVTDLQSGKRSTAEITLGLRGDDLPAFIGPLIPGIRPRVGGCCSG